METERQIKSSTTGHSKVLKGMPESLQIDGVDLDRELPRYIMMNMETTCPLRCLKCAQPGRNRKMGQPLSLANRKRILDLGILTGVKELVILGAGEPLLLKNYEMIVRPIIHYANEQGLGTVLFTTTLGLNRQIAEFLRDENVTVFVSFDSLDAMIYKKLTGGGSLATTLKNIQLLREVFLNTQQVLSDGRVLTRLAMNTTIQKDNVHELEEIKAFAGHDMQFICNVPMPEGKLRTYKNWEQLVGSDLPLFTRLAHEKSETGSHSSVSDEGVCSYFFLGLAVDSDGEFLTCAYASDSALHLGNARDVVTPEDFLSRYTMSRQKYTEWCSKIGRKPSCPLRDQAYENFIHSL